MSGEGDVCYVWEPRPCGRCLSPAARTESSATKFSPEDLAGSIEAPKQPVGKQCAPGNAGSSQTLSLIQARPPADRQPRAHGSSSHDGKQGHRSASLEAARLVREQQGYLLLLQRQTTLKARMWE
ncbi:hypothetical protein HPB47_009474, partial [Ixodes persulcatus]